MTHSNLPRVARSGCLAASVIVAVLLSACSGGGGSDASGDGKKDEATTSSSTTATTEAKKESTTTAQPAGPASEETKARALAAPLLLADFGEGWERYGDTDAVEVKGADDECLSDAGAGYDDLPEGSIAASPTVQLTGEQHFVSSEATVFATEDDAKAAMEWVNGSEWATCTEEFLQAFQDDNAPESGNQVAVEARETTGLGTAGFEGYGRFAVKNTTDEVVAYASYNWYRLDNVVLRVVYETGAIEDEAAYQASYADIDAAIAASYDRLADLGATPDD